MSAPASGQAKPSRSGAPATAGCYPVEWTRIDFLCGRDGVAAAADYCRRTSRIYRSAVLANGRRGTRHPHFASLPEYRTGFIRSYLDFKRFQIAHAPQPERRDPGSA